MGGVCHWCKVEQVQLCQQSDGMKYFMVYVFFINSCLKVVLQLVSSCCAGNWHVLFLLKRCPTMVKTHFLLVKTRKWCQPTLFPVQINELSLKGGDKSCQFVHFWRLETRLCSCSTMALKGYSCSLTTSHDQAAFK